MGTRCPLGKFKVPKEGQYPTHRGGQEHFKTAEGSDCAGLMFLAYHLGLDLEGSIAARAKILGLQVPEYGPLYAELHSHVCKVRKEQLQVQHRIFIAWCLIVTGGLVAALTWFFLAPSI